MSTRKEEDSNSSESESETPMSPNTFNNHQGTVITELLNRLEKNFAKEDYTPLYTALSNLRITRFAKARNYQLEEAWAMLEADVKWRKEMKVDEIYKNFPTSKNGPALIKYWPTNITKKKVGVDHRGLPFYVERIGQADPKTLMKAVSEEELIQFHIYIMEESEKKFMKFAEGETLKEQEREGVIFVEDASGLGWSQFYTPGFNLLQKLFAIDEAHYPAGLKCLYIINAPAIFAVFQKLITPFLDPVTVAKIQLLGSDYLTVLQNDVDLDQIPEEIGGKLQNPEEGGAVWPGGVYGGGQFENPLQMKEATVGARSKFEEKIQVTEERTVIAWEFRTKDYNIGFGVTFQDSEGKTQQLVPNDKVDSQMIVQSDLIAEQKGTYILTWDNTFSMLRSKALTYAIVVEKPLQKEPERKRSKKSKKSKKSKASKRKH